MRSPMHSPYLLLLAVSITFMLIQACKTKKQTVHYLFAFFCVSMAMTSLQTLSANSLGAYQYLIGLGACATCNMVWLISRALFREGKSLALQHYALAGTIAVLIMLSKTNAFLEGVNSQVYLLNALNGGINEVLNLLSSTILMLSLWEAFRHSLRSHGTQKWQGGIFAAAFLIGIFSCSILPAIIFNETQTQAAMPYLIVFSATLIMLAIQIVITLQSKKHQAQAIQIDDIREHDIQDQQEYVDHDIVTKIDKLIKDEQIYLKTNLKLSDLSQRLQLPEYKVSKTIRNHYKASNFNHFINEYRVSHAKQLMIDPSAQKWSLLVISLESGFSSLVTFNRCFKSLVGTNPTDYKKQIAQLNELTTAHETQRGQLKTSA